MTDQFKKIHPGAMSGMTGPLGGRGSKASLPRKRTRPLKERRKKPRKKDKTAKPESSMKTKKKYTVSMRRLIEAQDKVHSTERNIRGFGDRRLDEFGGKTFFTEKGGVRRDIQEFAADITHNQRVVNQNIRALKNLKKLKRSKKSAKDKSYEAYKDRNYLIDPAARIGTDRGDKASRGFKKEVNRQLKKSEREDSQDKLRRRIKKSEKSTALTKKITKEQEGKPNLFVGKINKKTKPTASAKRKAALRRYQKALTIREAALRKREIERQKEK